ncbi:bifunctional metallophosphatase/5'-nucleotidase [Haladaptatus salinisoli]|uniref:bifunctional metallophosphatase/5'-nucleotidase n=1 Tax=Haladaptatus salinisoli TaxID=2884876 RepID=UPI001D09BC84|nr:5'-nucleotidase C-terminal domain-containing protein [Haladaptatus salinisoli]
MVVRLLQYADVENAYDSPERIGRLAGRIEELRDERTFVCGAGDDTGPGVLSLVTGGRQSLPFFDAASPDFETFGNHDFDHGFDAIREIVRESPQRWLNANVERDGKRFAAEHTAPTALVERDGRRIGFVGVTAPETPDINPAAEELTVLDPVPVVRDAAAHLRDRGADHVVVLSHCGDDADLAELDVDVVLGGHEHEERIERVDGTLLTRPGDLGRTLLEVELGEGRPTATHHDTADATPDADVVAALRNLLDETGLTETVGTLDEPVLRHDRARKAGESRLGNLVVDAQRWRADADVALALGGIRPGDPLEGTVTAADLVGLMPYGNDLLAVELPGERLAEAFRELSLSYRYPDSPQYMFGHVSGATVTWDDRDDTLSEATVDGRPLDPERRYEVAVSEYFAEADNLFTSFDRNDAVRTCGTVHDALVEYARERGLDPTVDGRIRRPHFDPPTVR